MELPPPVSRTRAPALGTQWIIAIGFIVVLTLANGFFAASEIALLSARHGRLEQQAAQGSRAAARALELARDPDRFLTTVQIGITLVSTLAAAFGGARLSGELAGALRGIAWVGRHADGIAFALIVASITWLSTSATRVRRCPVSGETVPWATRASMLRCIERGLEWDATRSAITSRACQSV